jgi:predicted phosphodiesterase
VRTCEGECRQKKPDEAFEIGPNGQRRPICKTCRGRRDNARKKQNRAADRASASVQTIAILTDVHHPEHDRPFWRAFLLWLTDTRPSEVIIAGDFGEFLSVSTHGGNFGEKLSEDFAAVGKGLDEVRAASPDSKITFLCGNHDVRAEQTVAKLMPALAGVVTVASGLKLAERGIAYVDELHQPVKRGLLHVLHGHQFGGRFGVGKYHAAKAADVYGADPGTVVVYGHTHKPQTHTRAVMGGVVTATGLGCGRTISKDEVRWMRGAESGWVHEFGVALIEGDALVNLYPVRVTAGRFIAPSGKLYDGREPDAA